MIVKQIKNQDYTFVIDLSITEMTELIDFQIKKHPSPTDALQQLITTGLIISRACKDPAIKKISGVIDGFDLVRTKG